MIRYRASRRQRPTRARRSRCSIRARRRADPWCPSSRAASRAPSARCSCGVPTNGLSFHDQLCSSNSFWTAGSSSSNRASWKRAIVVDAGAARAAASRRAGDRAGRDEVRDLGEVAARPRQPHREGLGLHLVAPLHAPAPAARVADRHAGLRPARVFFDEGERRSRRAVELRRDRGQVERGDVARVAPDACARDASERPSGRPGGCDTRRAPARPAAAARRPRWRRRRDGASTVRSRCS